MSTESSDLKVWAVWWSQPSDNPKYPYRVNKSASVVAPSIQDAIARVMAKCPLGCSISSANKISNSGPVLLPLEEGAAN